MFDEFSKYWHEDSDEVHGHTALHRQFGAKGKRERLRVTQQGKVTVDGVRALFAGSVSAVDFISIRDC